MNFVRPLLVVGTRPEAIKMAPVILKCQQHPAVNPVVCFTGQHQQMLDQVADYFGLNPDVNLHVMQPNQTLSSLTTRCLEGLDHTIQRYTPDCVVAQGDTTTVLAAAMTAFYHRLPFVHVEAGLRTGNLQSPWPEEYNRRVAGISAELHCAPTQRSADALLKEGVPTSSIVVTGNTVVDALLWTVARERNRTQTWNEQYQFLGDNRMVLITGHRRENFGSSFESICRALGRLADRFPETQFIYPVHLNPNVREPVFRLLANRDNIRLIDPVAYPEFVWLMDRCSLIITDSGGVQEEAPSLGKPVLLMRDTTERPEAVDAGAVQLVGTDEDTLFQATATLLEDNREYQKRQLTSNPYGDGRAADYIVDHIVERYARRAAQLPIAA